MSDHYLSKTLQSVQPSATIGMSQKARQLAAEGKDVIILSQGEPDFETPDFIKQAAIEALAAGQTRYTNVDGIAPLKAAICAKFKRDNGLDYSPQNINVSPGGKAVIFNALLATLNPGDEVIIPAPCWVSYPEMTRLCGGQPIVVQTGAAQGYKLGPEALEAAISPKTRWLLLNSPSNPTGVFLTASDLKALADVLRQHPHVMVLMDDIYEHLLFDGLTFETMTSVAPDLKDRILTMNGMSKAYAMTGWRIGYAAGPEWLISGMRKVMSQSTSNPSSISQWASVAALNGPQDFLDNWRRAFEARRNLVSARLTKMNIDHAHPDGAFYIFGDCRPLLGLTSPGGRTLATDVDFTEALLAETFVALVPGSAFHADGHFRLSYALSEATLEIAMDRIEDFCKRCT